MKRGRGLARGPPGRRRLEDRRLGISYGGGAVLDSLVAGVPWAAVATAETWSDLYSALVPQGLLKSGLAAALSGSIPDARKSPELIQIQALAFSGQDPAAVKAWADARVEPRQAPRGHDAGFLAQGRRDFLFGIDQGIRAYDRCAARSCSTSGSTAIRPRRSQPLTPACS